MAKYELMYIISNSVADDEVPKITEEVKKYIESNGGVMEKHEELGKKKLAYTVAKTRNAFYVLDNFSAPADKINDIDQRIRTYQSIIRYLIINMDEALIRMEKDKVLQSKIKRRIPPTETKEEAGKPARSSPKTGGPKIEIDLDAEIEKAIDSKDLK